MKRILIFSIFFIGIISPKYSVAQAPNFRTAQGFALFTSVGAVTNTAATTINGNIGTNLGDISGFEVPSIVNGNYYTQDDTTSQAATDLLAAYTELFNVPTTVADHAAAFGTETITAGVYSIGGAGSLGGTLTLNAAGNADAVFIFKFGGAFTMGAGSAVILANKALAGNVYWIAEGAISMAANVSVKGTLIAHDAANSLGTNSTLEGRMFSTNGAVNVNNDVVTKICGGGYVLLPIKLLSFTGVCVNQHNQINWSTATETNNKYFTLERSENAINWEIITRVDGAIQSSVVRNYTYKDQLYQKGNYYYRLKQTDLDGTFKYGQIIYIKNCGAFNTDFIKVFPNPNKGKFKIFYDGDKTLVKLTKVFNATGEKVFEAQSFLSELNLSPLASGLYYLRLYGNGSTIMKEIIIKKD